MCPARGKQLGLGRRRAEPIGSQGAAAEVDSEDCENCERPGRTPACRFSAGAARVDLSGFWVVFVGFHVGYFEQPDTGRLSGMNSLGGNCRVCRVSIGVESFQETKPLIQCESGSRTRSQHRDNKRGLAPIFGIPLESRE